MVEYLETALIMFFELLLIYALFKAVIKTLTYIWELLK